jgi:ribosomal protein L37AE/L43A
MALIHFISAKAAAESSRTRQCPKCHALVKAKAGVAVSVCQKCGAPLPASRKH